MFGCADELAVLSGLAAVVSADLDHPVFELRWPGSRRTAIGYRLGCRRRRTFG